MITPKQFEAVRRHFMQQMYYYLGEDPDFHLWCHVPYELVSLQYRELNYTADGVVSKTGAGIITVFFDGAGNIVNPPEPVPLPVQEIPLDSGTRGEPDPKMMLKMFIPPFLQDDASGGS